MRLIYECVKTDKHPGELCKLYSILNKMKERGAEQCVLACTELPILFDKYLPNYPVIDATTILARATIIQSGCSLKPFVYN